MGWLIVIIVLGIVIYFIAVSSQHKQRLRQYGGMENKYHELITWLSKTTLPKNLKSADLGKPVILLKSYCEIIITIETTLTEGSLASKMQEVLDKPNSSHIDLWSVDISDGYITPAKSVDTFSIKETGSGDISIHWENTLKEKVTYYNTATANTSKLKLSWNYEGGKNNLQILKDIIGDINKLCKTKDVNTRENEIMANPDISISKPMHDSTISKLFTPVQKLAVIRLTWLLAGLSEGLLEKAQQPIKSIYQVLDTPYNSEVLNHSRDITSETACAILANHPEKEWILISLYSVVMADGIQTKDKEQLLSMYLEQLNVKPEEFNAVIKKANKFMNKFMS